MRGQAMPERDISTDKARHTDGLTAARTVRLWEAWREVPLEDIRDHVNDQAACRDDWSLMYPEPDDDAGIADALAVCATCPVRGACLVLSLRWHEDDYGVWGGTAPADRQALRPLLHPRRRQTAEVA